MIVRDLHEAPGAGQLAPVEGGYSPLRTELLRESVEAVVRDVRDVDLLAQQMRNVSLTQEGITSDVEVLKSAAARADKVKMGFQIVQQQIVEQGTQVQQQLAHQETQIKAALEGQAESMSRG